MVAMSTVKTEDGKVTCETAEGSVINININQRSALDCMLDAIKAFRITKNNCDAKNPARETGSAVPLGFGISLISVGILCVVVAVIIAVVQPSLDMYYSGTHFWVGFPFIVSGVLNVLTYRYPNPFWRVLAFLSLLACLGVSIAGMVFAVNDITWRRSNYEVCEDLVRAVQNPYDRNRYDGYDRNYRMTEAPRSYDGYQLDDCKRAMRRYQSMLCGLLIMSIVMMAWGICASVITLGHRLKAVWNACKCEKLEEESEEPILSPNPPKEVFIA